MLTDLVQIAVLEYLHKAFVGEAKEDIPCEPMCLVHQVFSMNFCDQVRLDTAFASPADITSRALVIFLMCVYTSIRPSARVEPQRSLYYHQHSFILFMWLNFGTFVLHHSCSF